MPAGRPRQAAFAAGLVLALGVTACSGAPGDPGGPASSSTTPAVPTDGPSTSPVDTEEGPITVGFYGTDKELRAYEAVVDSYNGSASTHRAELVTWPSHEAAMADILAGDVPDVFLAPRHDLRELLDRELVRPVSRLLDSRGVDFGDRFSRDGVESFAVDDDLQCMAYTVTPMVIYYNTDLVDFRAMRKRGLNVPESLDQWTFQEFAVAARFASRRQGATAGVHIQPRLRHLAPFLHSGGGEVFDDDLHPTTLTFSEESTREALDTTLTVLRDPSVTLSRQQQRRRTALSWFKRGRLGMIAGFRDLVPRLRARESLDFDVIAMPEIEEQATVGRVTGLCLSAGTENADDAADFITYASSDVAVERVARTGSVVPANTSVAGSHVFLEPGRRPAHSQVFTGAIEGMVIPPLVAEYGNLQQSVAPMLDTMLNKPGVLDLVAITRRIDAASRPVLARQQPEDAEQE